MEVSYGKEIALTARIWFLDAQSVSFQNPTFLLMHVYATPHYVMKKWETFPRPLQRAVWAQQHHQSPIPNLIPICSIYFSLFVLYLAAILSDTYSYDDLTTIFNSKPRGRTAHYVTSLICIFIETNYPKTIKTSFLCIVVLLWQ